MALVCTPLLVYGVFFLVVDLGFTLGAFKEDLSERGVEVDSGSEAVASVSEGGGGTIVWFKDSSRKIGVSIRLNTPCSNKDTAILEVFRQVKPVASSSDTARNSFFHAN